MLVTNYRVAPLPPRQRAMLDFAWRLTSAPESIGEADRQALRAAGLSDADLFDVSEVVAFFNYSNRMAQALDLMPNPEIPRHAPAVGAASGATGSRRDSRTRFSRSGRA